MTDTMMKIAGVRFRENWKVYDFDATNIDIAVGDRVIVDSDRGTGFAIVVRTKQRERPPEPEPVQMVQGLQVESEEPAPDPSTQTPRKSTVLRKVLRKATEDDLVRQEKNEEREAEAFKAAQDMIAERELPMKLIRVEYAFDGSRATFYFFSETRVDFRDLVKDLAFKLKSRIEMRQIGVRDVARMIGGFGPCGRELCCAAFLKNFEPVSIRMAKKQDMVLNPAKISGVCGRLLCCLSYEYGVYDEIKKDLAGMREAANQEKLEKKEREERIAAEERKVVEDRRPSEEKRRQDERRLQKQGREKQKDSSQKTDSRPEKKRESQLEKTVQPKQEQKKRDQPQQPRPEKAAEAEQTEKPVQQQDGEKQSKKKRRRFWRKKKKGQQPGPQGGGPQAPQ